MRLVASDQPQAGCCTVASTGLAGRHESGVHMVLVSRGRLRADLDLVQLQHQILEVLLLHWPALPYSEGNRRNPQTKRVWTCMRMQPGRRAESMCCNRCCKSCAVQTKHSLLSCYGFAAMRSRRRLSNI